MGMTLRIKTDSCRSPFMSSMIDIIMKRGGVDILIVHHEVPHRSTAYGQSARI